MDYNNKNQLFTYKNLHIDSDIYVVGSGPSLDFIDSSFFDNKIVIGINQIYKKNIKINYLIRKEFKLIHTVISETKDKNIIHFISAGNCGGDNKKNLININKKYSNHNNIVVFSHNKNYHKLPQQLPSDGLIVSRSTITSGIHLAAHMGAKNIILVGHDCGFINNCLNAKDYHTPETYNIVWKNGKQDYIKWLNSIEKDTIFLRKLIKEKYDSNIYSLNPFINLGLEYNKFSRLPE
jgi:uncharacterized Rossmann fold enzyme